MNNSSKKRCFIYGALPVKNPIINPESEDFVIACDRGLLNTERLGIKPNIVIGDFDSLGYVPQLENKIVLPCVKDDTDIGYAIAYAEKSGYDTFFIFGAIGGKADLTLANTALSVALSLKGKFALFFGENETVCSVTNGELEFSGVGEGRISVFATLGTAEGVTLKGLKYTLDNAVLSPEFPLGVSNSFSQTKSIVSVKKGTLTVIYEPKTIPEMYTY